MKYIIFEGYEGMSYDKNEANRTGPFVKPDNYSFCVEGSGENKPLSTICNKQNKDYFVIKNSMGKIEGYLYPQSIIDEYNKKYGLEGCPGQEFLAIKNGPSHSPNNAQITKKVKTMNNKTVVKTGKEEYKHIPTDKAATCVMCGKPTIKKKNEPDLCYGHWLQHTAPILPPTRRTDER